MYELFTSAFLTDAELKVASSIISGYSWDTPHRRLYRVLYFRGANPNHPKGLTKTDNIQGKPPETDLFALGLPNADLAPPTNARFLDPEWNELSNILNKQSYIVNASYEVLQDVDFENKDPIPANHFDVNPGALFWTQLPDPVSIAGGQALILQRKKIEIHDQLNLPTVLQENDFRFQSEAIEERQDIYHREAPVEFHFTRYYKLGTPGATEPCKTLPKLEHLTKVDPVGRWMLVVVAYVFEDQSPENIQAARDALTKVVDDLTPTGISFVRIDRKVYDTQLAATRNPAVQSFGQTQSLAGASGNGA